MEKINPLNFVREDEIFSDDSPLFLELISCKEFQRLKKIKQLGLCERVFKTATHNRYSHSLGVYNLSKIFIKNLGIDLKSKNARITMAAALLHDIGHGPFSHVFEKISKFNHELATIKIIKSKVTDINKILVKHKININAICEIYELKAEKPWMWQIISSAIDVDRMDYILRDSYMVKTKLGTIDTNPLILKTKLNIDNYIIHSYKNMKIIESFLESRLFMKQEIYENNDVILYEWSLINIFTEIKINFRKINKIRKEILHWDKFKFILTNDNLDLESNINIKKYLLLYDNLLIDFIKSIQYKNISRELEILINSFLTGDGLESEEVPEIGDNENYFVHFKILNYNLMDNIKKDNNLEKFENDILLFKRKYNHYEYEWFSNIITKKNDIIKIIKLKNTNLIQRKQYMKITDKIADLARKKFKSKSFTFYDLLDLVQDDKSEIKIDPSDLYVNIIEDVRFLSIGKQKWRMRETFKYEEVEKIKLTMFGDKEYQNLEAYEDNTIDNKTYVEDMKIDEDLGIIDLEDDELNEDLDDEIKEEDIEEDIEEE